jgi:hypothetical protein
VSALEQHENSQMHYDGLLPVPIGAFVAAHLNYLGGYPVQFEFAAPVGADLDRFQRCRSRRECPLHLIDPCVGKCFDVDGLQLRAHVVFQDVAIFGASLEGLPRRHLPEPFLDYVIGRLPTSAEMSLSLHLLPTEEATG